jgi:hypothetical protein
MNSPKTFSPGHHRPIRETAGGIIHGHILYTPSATKHPVITLCYPARTRLTREFPDFIRIEKIYYRLPQRPENPGRPPVPQKLFVQFQHVANYLIIFFNCGTPAAITWTEALNTTTGKLQEDAMGTLIRTLIAILAWVVPALAASSNEAEGSGLLLILFLGFGALIIVFQFVPGLVLFVTMVKELFTPAEKKAPVTAGKGPNET